MEKSELLTRALEYQADHQLNTEPLPIMKKDLVEGAYYGGYCRNADKAVWTGKEFIYRRYKFGDWFDETINHFEDDDGYDVFVPFEEIVNHG